jgi:hypothetical protein
MSLGHWTEILVLVLVGSHHLAGAHPHPIHCQQTHLEHGCPCCEFTPTSIGFSGLFAGDGCQQIVWWYPKMCNSDLGDPNALASIRGDMIRLSCDLYLKETRIGSRCQQQSGYVLGHCGTLRDFPFRASKQVAERPCQRSLVAFMR